MVRCHASLVFSFVRIDALTLSDPITVRTELSYMWLLIRGGFCLFFFGGGLYSINSE